MGHIDPALFITAVCLDGLVISVCIVELTLLLRQRCRGTFEPIELLLLSLCCSDLLCGLMSFIQDSIQLKVVMLKGQPNMVGWLAEIFDVLFIFFLLLSNFHVISIAVERFIAVVFPTKYSIFDSMRTKMCTLFMNWTVALIIAPFIYVMARFVITTKDGNMQGVIHTLYGSIFTAACIIVLVTYVFLFVMLLLRDRKMRELLPDDVRKQIRNRRNTFVCLLLGFSFIICILPHSLGLLNANLSTDWDNFLLIVYHVFNPIVYFIKYYVDSRRRTASQVSIVTREFSLTTTSTSST